LDELRGLRKDIRRIVVALEKLAGIEGNDSDEEHILWLESEGELTEVKGNKGKGKQREERLDGENGKKEVEVSQTSFSHISTNSSTIPTVSKPA